MTDNELYKELVADIKALVEQWHYRKDQTYTQTEILNLITQAIANLKLVEVVSSLPTTNIKNNILYLVVNHKNIVNNAFDIFIYANGDWEQIDKLEFSIANYYTKSEVDNLLATKSDVGHWHNTATQFANGYMSSSDKSKLDGIDTEANKTVVDSSLSDSSTNPVQNKVVKSALDTKAGLSTATTSANGLMSSSDKSKLDGIATGANKTVVDSSLSDSSTNPVQNKVVKSALDTKAGLGTATTSANGLMSSSDKSKLDGIATGANKTVVDSSLSDSSTNPVQNKVVKSSLDTKVDKISGKGLSTNDYTTNEKNKLAGIEAGANKTIVDSALSTDSTNPVQNNIINRALNNLQDNIDEVTTNGNIELQSYAKKSELATVATSGSYNDLSNKPTIPSANATASNIKMNGTQSAGSLASFAKADHVHPVDTSRAASSHTHTKSQITDFPTSMTPASHVHGNISNAGAIGSTANLPIITDTNGVLKAGSFGTAANTFCQGNDSRLSNARTPTSHAHGNITNAGAIGSTANLPIITDTNGVLKAGSFGTAANTFCQGNDSRLSNARTPTAHTHDRKDIGNFNNYVVGTQTAATNVWTGTCNLQELTTGTVIYYKLPFASTNADVTLNLTLANGTTTGAKNVFFWNGTRLRQHYGVNSVVGLIYNGTEWWVINPSTNDTNTTYSVVTQSANGLMSSTDKTKLDGIDTGANKTTLNNTVTSTSTTEAATANAVKTAYDKGNHSHPYVGTSDSRLTDARTPIFNLITASSSNIQDLNNYKTGGFYYTNSDANYAPYIIHCPWSNGTATPYTGNKSFFLLVETWGTTSNYVKQTLTYYTGNNTYVRTCSNGTWGNWKELNTNNNDYLRVSTRIIAGEAIATSRIIGGTTDGKYYPITSGKILDTKYPILFNTSAITSGSYTDNVYVSHTGVPLTNNVSGKTVTSQKQVYVEGTSYDGRQFIVSDKVFVSEDNLTDGRYYIYIGVSYSTTYIRFNSFHQNVYIKTRNGLVPVGDNTHNPHYLSYGSAGTVGYFKFLTIRTTGTYHDETIEFDVTHRGNKPKTRVSFNFETYKKSGDTTNLWLRLAAFYYDGYPTPIYCIQTNDAVHDATFDFYIKRDSWDAMGVSDLRTSINNYNGMTVTWYNEFTETLPSGTTQATINPYYKDTNTTYTAESTATNIKMNGTQAVGSLSTYARGDHVHPTDTSRVAVAQGSGNANKSLCTDANGNVALEAKNNHTHSYSASNHTHGNITNAGAIGSTANLPIITDTNGVLKAGSFGTAANTFCQGNDSRLSNARTPTSHAHGNITNAGAIGSTANLPIITDTNGVLKAGSFGTAANTFCQGNDSRLSNARTPTAHQADTNAYGAATTAKWGHTKLNSAIDSTDETTAATPKAVKTAYDKGNHSHPYAASSHNHNTWDLIKGGTTSDVEMYLSANEQLQICSLWIKIYLSSWQATTYNTSSSATLWKTTLKNWVPAAYRPYNVKSLTTNHPNGIYIIDTAGNIGARFTVAQSSGTDLIGHGIWEYDYNG